MIRFLLTIGLVLVVAILVRNYFFGDDEEKKNSLKVFGQVRSVVVSVGQLIKSEKEKFDAGKYDAALETLGDVYKAVRTQARHIDEKVIRRLDELENRKADLEQELQEIEAGEQPGAAPSPKGKKKDAKAEQEKAAKTADQNRRKEQLLRELEDLVRDSDALLQDAGNQK